MDRVKTSFTLGLNAFKQSRWDDALTHFNQCIASAGNSHQAYDARAATLEKLGRSKDALKDCRKVIELLPGHPKGYLRAARLFEKTDKLEAAVEMARMAQELISESDATKYGEVSALYDRLKSRLDRARTCHPHKLPMELLSMIFLEWSRLDSIAALKASHVCQYWRDAALSTALLWTTLILGRKKPIIKTSTWLLRSRGRCHTLRLNESFSVSMDNRHWLRDSLQSQAAMKTVTDLELHGATAFTAQNLLRSLSEGIRDGLKRLVVSSPYHSDYLGCPSFDMSTFMNLEVLDLINLRMPDSSLKCERLRILRLRDDYASHISYLELLRTICNLKDLEELEVHGTYFAGYAGEPVFEQAQVQFPLLKRLSFGGPTPWSNVVRCLYLPSLRTLELSGCARVKVQEFMSHIRPSDPPLTHLCINSTSFTQSELLVWIRCLPSLVRLEISRSADLSNVFIETLLEPSSPPQFPKLEHLNFSQCINISGGPLLRLVRSRLQSSEKKDEDSDGLEIGGNNTVTSIKTLIVDGCPKVDHGVADTLRKLVTRLSCVYQSKEDTQRRRRRDP